MMMIIIITIIIITKCPKLFLAKGRITVLSPLAATNWFIRHQIHGCLDSNESATKQHLDRFSHFCTAHPHAQHTSVAIGLCHIIRTICRQCGLMIMIDGEEQDILLLWNNNFSNFITRAGLLPAFRYIFGHLQNKRNCAHQKFIAGQDCKPVQFMLSLSM